MIKKKKFIVTVTALLMAYVAIVPTNGSLWFIGEPKLPKRLDK